jgi:hypothetical protein
VEENDEVDNNIEDSDADSNVGRTMLTNQQLTL